ncbi:hypothetical protein MRS44_006877 [Fusarium solani]|uniref:uncharacterized protein n=1 Tax=Fusarium solani TaxID=169388 RepID=UPI0032C44BD7|nr:hypothetical protein MRS44_006877 [Fusarium solani]
MDLRPSASTGSGNGENIQVKDENATRRGPQNGGRLPTDPITNRLGSHAVASSDGDRHVCASPDMHIAIFSSFLTLSNTGTEL